MDELLVFDNDMWATITGMLQSKDKENRELAYGMLEGIDYNNSEQMELFEEKMLSSILIPNLEDEQKGKLFHCYFTLIEKQNGNIN